MEDRIQRLNTLMTEYSKLKDDPLNSAVCINLRAEAQSIVFEDSFRLEMQNRAHNYLKEKKVLGNEEDIVQEASARFLEKCFPNYDYKINDNFYLYLMNTLKMTALDLIKKEYKNVKKGGEGLDEPSGGDIPSDNVTEEQVFARMRLEEFYARMAVCVIKIGAKNGEPDKYYRSFATGYYIMLCKERLYDVCEINENEAFTVMDTAFADFTLISECRTFYEIESTPLKTYYQIGLNGDEEIDVPIKPRVYTKYHNVTSGYITQKRNKFDEMLGIV